MSQKNTTQKSLPNWVQQKHEENVKTQEEFLNKKYLNLQQGTQTIWINMDEVPMEIDGDYGKRYQYKAKADPAEEWRIMSVSKNLDRMIVEVLSSGKNPLQITRIGTGKNTRFAVA